MYDYSFDEYENMLLYNQAHPFAICPETLSLWQKYSRSRTKNISNSILYILQYTLALKREILAEQCITNEMRRMQTKLCHGILATKQILLQSV